MCIWFAGSVIGLRGAGIQPRQEIIGGRAIVAERSAQEET